MRIKNEPALRFLKRVPEDTRSQPKAPPPPPPPTTAPANRAAVKDGFESAAPSRAGAAATASRPGDVQSLMRQQFGTLSADRQQFHDTMRGVFGEGYDAGKAEQYRQQSLAGNFDWMPPVQWVDASVLQGGHGAYDSQSGAVLLNRELQGNPSLAASTYVEEAGHHLDAQLNTVDSQGDEGELFRRVLGGEKLSGAQIAEMRAENDKGTIQLNGRSVEVEFRRNIFQRIGGAVGGAVSGAVRAVGNAVGNVAQTVGNVVGNVAQRVGNVAREVGGAAMSVGAGLLGGVRNFATGIFQGVGGFLSNMARFNVADAFQSLVRGADRAFLQTPQRILSGVFDGAQHLFAGAGELLGGRVGAVVRDVGTRLTDAARTLSDTVLGVGRDIFRTVTETPLTLMRGVEESLELAARGQWGAAASRFGRGLLETGSRALGGVVDVFMRTVQGVANAALTAAFVEAPSRSLSGDEIQMLRQVYGDSIDYSQVRVKVGGSTDALGIAPHVVGNTIYLRSEWGGPTLNPDGTLTAAGRETLIHEAGHIWQNQNGGGDFVHRSLFAQLTASLQSGSRNGAYEWREAFSQGRSFEELNPEQQAHLMEDIGVGMMNDGAVQPGDWTPPLSAAELSYVMSAWEKVRRGEGSR
jgi:hypothetical protein